MVRLALVFASKMPASTTTAFLLPLLLFGGTANTSGYPSSSLALTLWTFLQGQLAHPRHQSFLTRPDSSLSGRETIGRPRYQSVILAQPVSRTLAARRHLSAALNKRRLCRKRSEAVRTLSCPLSDLNHHHLHDAPEFRVVDSGLGHPCLGAPRNTITPSAPPFGQHEAANAPQPNVHQHYSPGPIGLPQPSHGK